MKFLKYLPFALAITLIVGCSDDNFTTDEKTPDTEVLAEGGAVSVRIHLPSTTATGTRATEVELNDGLAQEYAVNDATIILFDANERFITQQTFLTADLNFTTNANNNITSNSVEVKIGPNSKTPKYAAVFINMTQVAASTLNYSTFNDSRVLIAGPNNAIVQADGLNYFFMSNSTFDNTNAPVSVYRSATGLQTLQELDPTSIKSTSVASSTEASTNIYVERAAVKVELTFSNNQAAEVKNSSAVIDGTTGFPTISFTAAPFAGDQIQITGWALTVTNKTYYPTKLLDANIWPDWQNNNTYFMAPYVSRPADFRTHFAIDGNFNGNVTPTAVQGYYDEFNYVAYSNVTNPCIISGDTNYLYCLENTFDNYNQEQNQTTAVIIAGKYVKSSNTDTSGDIFKLGNTIYGGDGADLINHILGVLKANGYTCMVGETPIDVKATDIKINKGAYIYKDLVMANSNICRGGAVIAGAGSSMDTILNSLLGFRALAYYKAGSCYYTIPIRHFNDEQVPLLDSDGDLVFFGGAPTAVNAIEQTARYGVVRNNWYTIDVSSIAAIGRPVPVDPADPINPDPNFPDPKDPDPNNPDPTPDDVVNTYLQAKINVLPWAKRVQKIKL